MPSVGQREIKTQAEAIAFFQNELGYRYLGFWKERAGNSNIEVEILTEWLSSQGHDHTVITKVLREIDRATSISGTQHLYDANKKFYGLLRYGIRIKPGSGEQTQTVFLIDWKTLDANDFAIAEEVTVEGNHTKRPDIVIYLNGIALGVLELKRSTISISEGIRQNLDNQKPHFIESFFSTIQLVMAGNDSQGLRYGVIQTSEKYYLEWKKRTTDPADKQRGLLQRGLHAICRKDRFLELIHDFIVFDAGVKKIARHNQYHGVKAAHEFVKRRENGIIWHTQGSGKSLVMVWLAKWIREHVTNSRVLIVTDRVELDDQIKYVFSGVNEDIYRAQSCNDLVKRLNTSDKWLMCSLVHKFEDFADELAREVKSKDGFEAKGDFYVFVDECHRGHSGVFHAGMRAALPKATFFGFTGTPLLKKDKKQSREVFGDYIDTYKFDEAVEDGVILDLRYEAREIEQHLSSPELVDQWFEAKTSGLNDIARSQLKKRWGTLQHVRSAQSRLEKIKADILMDFATRDRLRSGKGNALLVAGSIYEACKFYELFQNTELADHSAIITSYEPTTRDITGEASGEGQTEQLRKYDIYRKMLAKHFNTTDLDHAMHRTEEFETEVRNRFKKEPGRMKLLIVVDKLLTGFDAPPATYLYIDKNMQDHGLFQAICRVNRLDSTDKEYGYIVDYKDLFKALGEAIDDYTGEAFDAYDKEDVQGLLKDRLSKARERLEEVRETIKALCEPVLRPRDTGDYISYFCSDETADIDTQVDDDRKRILLYRYTSAYLRAYASIANEMADAKYSAEEAVEIKAEVTHYEQVREVVKLSSGDYIDLKMYEPAMRHLLDTYIRAEESRVLSNFNDFTLVQMLARDGAKAVEELPERIRTNKDAVAETIENNVRKVIIDEMAANPKYFESMSEVLEAIIKERRQQSIEYSKYLEKIVALTHQITSPAGSGQYPEELVNEPQRAFYDNLNEDEALAMKVDESIRSVKKADWRGNRLKEREVLFEIAKAVGKDVNSELVTTLFDIALNQREY